MHIYHRSCAISAESVKIIRKLFLHLPVLYDEEEKQMENIQIILLIAIVAVAFIRQRSRERKPNEVSLPPEVLADNTLKPAPRTRVRHRQPAAVPETPAATPWSATPPVVRKKPVRPLVRFATRDDARQAFILSEIFHRKY